MLVRHALPLLGLLALSSAWLDAGGQGPPADPAGWARAIQAHYDTVADLTADFVHVYRGSLLRQTASERGSVRFKKPGMMRWTYTAPEPKEFVADGVRLYAYLPQDRQVTITALPDGPGMSTPALFLAGRGNLTRDFTADAPDPGDVPDGAVGVKLTPRQPQSDFEWMTLVVDPSTLRIRGLVTVDAQGGRSSFTFDRVRENMGLQAKVFRFTIPRGVDVITHPQRER